MALSIEKNVPIPSGYEDYPDLYRTLRQMEAGDSVFVPNINYARAQAVWRFVRWETGRLFKSEREGDGLRIWCVKSKAQGGAA